MLLDRRDILLGAGGMLAAGTMVASALAGSGYDSSTDIYAALAKGPSEHLKVGEGMIEFVFADGAPGVDRGLVRAWIRDAARAMTVYFGHFPVQHYGLLIVADDGDGVGHATTFGYRGSVTRIHVGREATAPAFAKDWVLVHEMSHAALPDLPRRALWLQEGNATWIEPVARAQAGLLSATEVWRETIEGMPNAYRRVRSGGMDGTTDWGRLYWGGALFWLEAEIAIYVQTGGRHLLRDALRRINRVSGGNSADWQPEQMMAVGDNAVGTSALRSLYAQYASEGPTTNLDALFRRLGVSPGPSGTVFFDRHAELAPFVTRLLRP